MGELVDESHMKLIKNANRKDQSVVSAYGTE